MAVYLDSIRVSPRRDLLKVIDEYSISSDSVSLTDDIRFKLVELLPLGSVPDDSYADNDIALVVRVPFHRRGTLMFGLGAVLGWRPLVTIEFDVISLANGETLEILHSTKKLSWSGYIKGLVRLNSIFHFKPEFGFADLEPLIEQSVLSLLNKVRTKYS
ncbi:TPA: hypothetical protein ACMDXT_004627 [Vibrio parahaemolyticus]